MRYSCPVYASRIHVDGGRDEGRREAVAWSPWTVIAGRYLTLSSRGGGFRPASIAEASEQEGDIGISNPA